MSKHQTGAKNGQWKGGRTVSQVAAMLPVTKLTIGVNAQIK